MADERAPTPADAPARADAVRCWQQVRLFTGADPHDLAVLAERAEDRSFPAGTVVVDDASGSSGLHVIVEGRVVVDEAAVGAGNGCVQVALGPGDTIGELAALTGEPPDGTARARAATRTLFLSRAALLATLRDRPALALTAIAALARWAKRADRRAAELALRAPASAPFGFRRLYPAPGEVPEIEE